MNTETISADRKLSQEEKIVKVIQYAKVFDTGVEPRKIADLLAFAGRFVIPGNERQAAMLHAMEECVSAAKSGKPLRLSPEMHQLNVLSFAVNACQDIVIQADCEVENAKATFDTA